MSVASPEDVAFAEAVFALFERHGKLLGHDVTWYVEQLDEDYLKSVRRELGMPERPAIAITEPDRAHYHELLDKAMDLTREGETFLKHLVNMVVMEKRS